MLTLMEDFNCIKNGAHKKCQEKNQISNKEDTQTQRCGASAGNNNRRGLE